MLAGKATTYEAVNAKEVQTETSPNLIPSNEDTNVPTRRFEQNKELDRGSQIDQDVDGQTSKTHQNQHCLVHHRKRKLNIKLQIDNKKEIQIQLHNILITTYYKIY